MFTYSLRSTAALVVLFVAAAVFSPSLSAQTSAAADPANSIVQTPALATPATADTAERAPALGPRLAPVGITRQVQTGPLVLTGPQEGAHIGAGSNLALMGVGVAGVVIGLLVGGNAGTAIAIGSGVVGLVGLYRFLK